MNDQTTTAVRVWDLPTRLFHWMLAACVLASIATAWVGGNAMNWHFKLGWLAMVLLMFRLVWGMVGGRWSRFASFIYAPSALARYLRRASRADEHHEVGHNPLGALSVFAVLAVLSVQVATGLFADDEIANTGPLNKFVSNATGLKLTHWHSGPGQWLILALIALHVGAIGYYLVARRRNLIGSMLSGDKLLAVPAPAAVDNWRSRSVAFLLLLICAGVASWIWGLGA